MPTKPVQTRPSDNLLGDEMALPELSGGFVVLRAAYTGSAVTVTCADKCTSLQSCSSGTRARILIRIYPVDTVCYRMYVSTHHRRSCENGAKQDLRKHH